MPDSDDAPVYPAPTVDATINKSMDQAFVGAASLHQTVLALADKSAAQLSNLTDNSFNQQTQLWQSNAAQVLMGNKLAQDILHQRSAGGQPQAAGGPGGKIV